jgi:phytoene/squalene synthetase
MNAQDNLFAGNTDLAASITRVASSQTYYTIRLLVDPQRVPDAFRTYGYFRWLDDRLDQDGMQRPDRLAFVDRQVKLMQAFYRGDGSQQPSCPQESFLLDLIQSDREKNSGLRAYIHNMMAVMVFDAERRGRLITRDELAEYTRHLAVAVTEAMHYFIGHSCKSPQGESRYLAVSAAHITHMLRDTLEDVEAGYFNIPRETLDSHGIDPREVLSAPYRKWVQARVELARAYFKQGKDCLAQAQNPRCRLAGFAYSARFEGVLDAIEQDGYRLRPTYPECKSFSAGSSMLWSALLQTFSRRPAKLPYALPTR